MNQEAPGWTVRNSVEETMNSLLDAEADAMCGAQRYERSADRVDTRAGTLRVTSPALVHIPAKLITDCVPQQCGIECQDGIREVREATKEMEG